MYLRLLETLPKHGLVSTFRICFLKEKSLEKWRRALLRVACPAGPVDSCVYEVDNLSYTCHLNWFALVWNTNIFCAIGLILSPHPGLQLPIQCILMSLPRIPVSSAPLWHILVKVSAVFTSLMILCAFFTSGIIDSGVGNRRQSKFCAIEQNTREIGGLASK